MAIAERHLTGKQTVAEHLTTVKAAWDKAPDGAKKDAAHRHYHSAETSHAAKHDADATKGLDAAPHALA